MGACAGAATAWAHHRCRELSAREDGAERVWELAERRRRSRHAEWPRPRHSKSSGDRSFACGGAFQGLAVQGLAVRGLAVRAFAVQAFRAQDTSAVRWQDIDLIRPHSAIPINFAAQLFVLSRLQYFLRIRARNYIQKHWQRATNTYELHEQTWLMPTNYGELLGSKLAIY
jgi:hypothetical protein